MSVPFDGKLMRNSAKSPEIAEHAQIDREPCGDEDCSSGDGVG